VLEAEAEFQLRADREGERGGSGWVGKHSDLSVCRRGWARLCM
jgi:hypothetical protein